MSNFINEINRFLFRADAGARRRLWLKLSKLLLNGVPILDALSSLHQRRVALSGKTHPTSLALGAWMAAVKNGRRVSEAIRGWVGSDEQMLIEAGEYSGTIGETMQAAAGLLETKKKIKTAVVQGLAYPVTLLLVAFAVLIMFSFKVIPQFSQIIPDEKWYGIARIMINFADFSRDWFPFIIGGIVGLIILFFWSLPRWSEGMRIWLDQYPPYNVYRVIQGSTWMLSFSALVAAGMRTETALEKLSEGTSPWIRNRIRACLRGMRGGLNVADALSQSRYGFPDIEIIDDLGVYSRLSGFDQALDIIGREWMTEATERIKGMMSVVFGVMLLLVSVFIAFMIGGLIGMELQMASLIRTPS